MVEIYCVIPPIKMTMLLLLTQPIKTIITPEPVITLTLSVYLFCIFFFDVNFLCVYYEAFSKSFIATL